MAEKITFGSKGADSLYNKGGFRATLSNGVTTNTIEFEYKLLKPDYDRDLINYFGAVAKNSDHVSDT